MVLHCAVPECKNNAGTPGISLHRFPTDQKKKRAWFLRMRYYGKVTPAMRICSAHFLPQDYKHVSNLRKLLKEGAEPSVFPYDTSQETKTPLRFLLSTPESTQASQYFLLKEKTAAAFPFKVHKVQDSCIEKETSRILPQDFSQSHPVSDPEALKWLKRSKKTKRNFINYFESGMSPAVAIQHHESMLCLIDSELIYDNKRNPPTEWVYSLYSSWLNEKKEKASTVFANGKQRVEKKCDALSMKSDVLVKVPSMIEADTVVHQTDTQVPCVIHMNNKLEDDYEDLKYLLIPNEVYELFYKYFDDGLNVSEAMKLNEENLKRNKNWPQFNPSERVVNYIYKIWHQQIKPCDETSKDSGFTSFSEKKYLEHKSLFEGSDEETDCQNKMGNFIATSHLSINSDFQELVTVSEPQPEVNFSSENAVELLTFPFIPSNSSSKPLNFIKNDDLASEVTKDFFSLTDEKLCEKLPILASAADCMLDPVQNQFVTSTQNSIVSLVSSTDTVMNSSSSNFCNNQISAVSAITETKTLHSPENSSPFYEEKTQELLYSLSQPCYYSYQSLSESSRHCQTTFSNSFNEVKISNYCEPPVMTDSSIFYPSTIYGSNISFEINSEFDRNENHSFYQFVDKSSESDSRMANEIKGLNNISSATQTDSQANIYSSDFPTFTNEYPVLQEMSNKSKVNNFMELEELNYTPANMNLSSVNCRNEIAMSFTDEEENEECTNNFSIASLEFSKQNEDQKFLLSLLPEFECIPDSFKIILKDDIFNLVHSTKLRANKQQIEKARTHSSLKSL